MTPQASAALGRGVCFVWFVAIRSIVPGVRWWCICRHIVVTLGVHCGGICTGVAAGGQAGGHIGGHVGGQAGERRRRVRTLWIGRVRLIANC